MNLRSLTITAEPEAISSQAELCGDAHLCANAESIIRKRCEEEWGTEYDMRIHCEEEERDALTKLLRGKPMDIPDHVFTDIRKSCAREWPEEFGMRLHCEEERITAYRKLKAGS